MAAYGRAGHGFKEPGELYIELLPDAIKMTHSDPHPPGRPDFAERVTADLLELKAYLVPKPPPPPNWSKRVA